MGISSPKHQPVDILTRMTLTANMSIWALTSLPSPRPGVSGLHAAAAPRKMIPTADAEPR